MALSLVKTGAIAATVLVMSATSSFAATWAQVEQDSSIRSNHSNLSSIVNYVDDGDMVQIIGSWGDWYKISIPGPNGWIRKYKLDLTPDPGPSGPGVNFCFYGPLGYVCVNN